MLTYEWALLIVTSTGRFQSISVHTLQNTLLMLPEVYFPETLASLVIV